MKTLITKLYKRGKMNVPSKELKLHIPVPQLIDPEIIVTEIQTSEDSNETLK